MITLAALKSALGAAPGAALALTLPDGSPVPVRFHVTEVGRVSKRFVDCGGTRRESDVCLMQVWLGDDEDHRLSPEKLLRILASAADLLDDALPVEIEYEHGLLSQYPVVAAANIEGTLTLGLEKKHTACLAPDLCVRPAASPIRLLGPVSGRCGPSGCC